ncbi:MAG TPA: zinc-ribbon domain-containing protein [Xanthobacteraceae bacterium]
MLIVCPNCTTSYHVDPSAVGPTGRSVRCVRCRTVWFAANTADLAEIAASHRADMAQFAAGGPSDALPPDGWPEDLAAPGQTGGEASDPNEAAFGADAPAMTAADSANPADDALSGPPMPVVESPALAPIEHEAVAEPVQAEDIESVAARRALEQARKRRFGLPLTALPTMILGLVLIDLGLLAWRAEIVRILPQTAAFYGAIGLPVNVRGLVITDVTTATQTQEGVPVLLVQGRIVSATKRFVEIPRLRFAVRNEVGNEIYTWTALPSRSLLGPGETLAFQSRLASPPPETRDVQVRFFNRRDLGVSSE